MRRCQSVNAASIMSRRAELAVSGDLIKRAIGKAVEVLDGSRVVARHERAAGKYAEILVLDHYLEVLQHGEHGTDG